MAKNIQNGLKWQQNGQKYLAGMPKITKRSWKCYKLAGKGRNLTKMAKKDPIRPQNDQNGQKNEMWTLTTCRFWSFWHHVSLGFTLPWKRPALGQHIPSIFGKFPPGCCEWGVALSRRGLGPNFFNKHNKCCRRQGYVHVRARRDLIGERGVQGMCQYLMAHLKINICSQRDGIGDFHRVSAICLQSKPLLIIFKTMVRDGGMGGPFILTSNSKPCLLYSLV